MSSQVIPVHRLWRRRTALSLNSIHLPVFVQHQRYSPLPTSCQLPLTPSLVPAVSLMSLEIRAPVTLHIFKSVFQQHLCLSPLPTSHENLIITPCSLPAVSHHQHHPHLPLKLVCHVLLCYLMCINKQ